MTVSAGPSSRVDSTCLVQVEIIVDPLLQELERLLILLGAHGGQLLDGFTIGPEMFGLLPEDFFRAVEPPLQQVICDLHLIIVSKGTLECMALSRGRGAHYCTVDGGRVVRDSAVAAARGRWRRHGVRCRREVQPVAGCMAAVCICLHMRSH